MGADTVADSVGDEVAAVGYAISGVWLPVLDDSVGTGEADSAGSSEVDWED